MAYSIVFPTGADAPDELKRIRRPSGCGPFAAWAVLEFFGVSRLPVDIVQACRFHEDIGTHMADIAAALVDFGLQVEFSANHEPEIDASIQALAADRRARESGVTFSAARTLRELEPLLDGTRVAILAYNTERTERHIHFSPLTRIRERVATLPLETYGNAIDLDVLEYCRGYHGVQQACLLVTTSRAANEQH